MTIHLFRRPPDGVAEAWTEDSIYVHRYAAAGQASDWSPLSGGTRILTDPCPRLDRKATSRHERRDRGRTVRACNARTGPLCPRQSLGCATRSDRPGGVSRELHFLRTFHRIALRPKC